MNSSNYNKLIVLSDKPMPPQGPLEVSDITPETCCLTWKPPLDDGGSPITNYVVEKLETSTGVSTVVFLFYQFTGWALRKRMFITIIQ